MYDTKPKCRLFETLKSQGMRAYQGWWAAKVHRLKGALLQLPSPDVHQKDELWSQ
jgi:hypothetical protein